MIACALRFLFPSPARLRLRGGWLAGWLLFLLAGVNKTLPPRFPMGGQDSDDAAPAFARVLRARVEFAPSFLSQ